MEKIVGQGCPSSSLQGVVGQFYENTNTGDIYECQSIVKDCDGAAHYSWVLRASGEHIDRHAEIFGGGGGNTEDIERRLNELNGEIEKKVPDGAVAHQMLVTDENGVSKWEDRTHYDTSLTLVNKAIESGDITDSYGILVRLSEIPFAESELSDIEFYFADGYMFNIPTEEWMIEAGAYAACELLFNIYADNVVVFDYTFPSKGVYVFAIRDDSMNIAKVVRRSGRKLDAAYLPLASKDTLGIVSYSRVAMELVNSFNLLAIVVGETTLAETLKYHNTLFPCLTYEEKAYFGFGWPNQSSNGSKITLYFNAININDKTICTLALTFNGKDYAALLENVTVS